MGKKKPRPGGSGLIGRVLRTWRMSAITGPSSSAWIFIRDRDNQKTCCSVVPLGRMISEKPSGDFDELRGLNPARDAQRTIIVADLGPHGLYHDVRIDRSQDKSKADAYPGLSFVWVAVSGLTKFQ